MIPNFIQNFPFEVNLEANLEFNYTDNKLVYDDDSNSNPNLPTHQDFTEILVAPGVYVYTYKKVLGHSQAFQNVKSIDNVYYSLFPHIDDSDGVIKFRFRYSTDNNTFTTWDDLTDDNLETIPETNLLWIQLELSYTLSEEPKDDVFIPINNIYIEGTRFMDEIYEPTTIEPGGLKIFTAQDTYKVFKTTGYELFLAQGDPADLDIYFRYTQNQGRNWADWKKLNDENLQRADYIAVKFTDFQFGFNNIGSSNIKLYDMELLGDFQNVTGNYKRLGRYGLKTQCNPIVNDGAPTDCLDCGNDNSNNDNNFNNQDNFNNNVNCGPCSAGYTPWNPTGCDNLLTNNVANINDMNLMNSVVDLHDQLNKYVEAKTGWDFDYYYTDPDKKGVDMILYENQLLNVIMKRPMKVVVPENQFPSDQISFSGFGMDLILQFEVHILRDSFKKVFGVESRPREGDYMYLCNTNLIYEVEQVLDKKDVMNATFYWRVILKKYEQQARRRYAKTKDGQDAKNTTEALVKYTTLDDLFSDDNSIDIKKNSQKQEVHLTEGINESQQANDHINNNRTLISELDKSITFNHEVVWNASNIVSENQYVLPYMRTNGKRMIEYKFDDNSVNKTHNRGISMWIKFENHNHEYDYLLFNNYDYNKQEGYKLQLFDGKLIFTINQDNYELPVILNNNVWYAIYAFANQEDEDMELAVYRRQSENGKTLSNSNLIKVAGYNMSLNKFEFEIEENLYIGGVDINYDPLINHKNKDNYFITNIRLWTEPITKKKRSAILNQQKVKDTHLVRLTDAAHEDYRLSFYGNM